MKRHSKQLVAFLLVASSLFFAAQAWSAIDFVKPTDSAKEIGAGQFAPSEGHSKSHAPEPASLALFGSGFLSMLITLFRRTYALSKRAIDIAGAIVGMVVFTPIMLIVALLVKLTSRGPVFYSQVRVGKDGQHFDIYKFRTMRTDAESKTGPVWAAKNDGRLTPIGYFLRKSRVDELPQFVNVLKGDMSLIGPRPERPIFVEKFKQQICDYEKRLEIKPGITGLAQVHHHYDETINDVRKKIKYDILYIKKVCLWTDLRILLRTVRVVLTGAGAK